MTRRGLLACAASAALLVALPTRPCGAQAFPVGAPAIGLAGPPSFASDRLGWRASEPLGLDESPLGVLRGPPRWAIESEWAPLYRGRDGATIEQSRQTLRAAAVHGRVVVGAEASREASLARGGEARWGVDAGGAPLRLGTLGLALRGRGLECAAAASALADGGAGFSIQAAAPVARGWSADVRASNLPRRGTLGVRWEDRVIAARGAWSERTLVASVTGTAWGSVIQGTLESFDRVTGAPSPEPDVLEPRLSWRAARGLVSSTGAGLRASAEIRHGEGRQRLDVRRGGTAYATAVGQMSDDAVMARVAPATARWEVLGWGGRCRGSLDGSLALWPFDGLGAALGTRFAARSGISLRHWGLGIDGQPSRGSGFDAGMALWAIDPEGGYESWRGTWFGLGRDDYQQSALTLGRTLLAGVRLARTQAWDALALRLEVMQWAPIRADRRVVAHATEPEGGSASGGAGPAPGRATEWGGTMIRLSVTGR